MNSIGILHLSDFHMSFENKDKLNRLKDAFFKDVKYISEENKVKIEMICITGDMINRGSKSAEEYQLFLDNILFPLMIEFELNEDKVFLVPGNHEVNIESINKYTEDGLLNTLQTTDSINSFFENIRLEDISRISSFKDFSDLFSGEAISENELYSCYINKIQNVKFGIACINSAWRSSGKGTSEKTKMILGKIQIEKCAKALEDCDIKICLFHHPIDWLVDCDKCEVEKKLYDFDIVLNGHIHELDSKVYISFNGQTVYNTSGKFDLSSDVFNGYSLIKINPNSHECNILLRHYFDIRNSYDKAIHLTKEGELFVDLKTKNYEKKIAYLTASAMRDSFLDYANTYLVTNVVNDYIKNTFEEIFIEPLFKLSSEYEKELALKERKTLNIDQDKSEGQAEKDKLILLKEICSSNKNYLIYGKKEMGKTTLLHYFVKYYCDNINTLGKVPIIIDCKSNSLTGKNAIPNRISTFILETIVDDYKISKTDILKLLNEGLIIIFFDNYDAFLKNEDQKSINLLNDFIATYSNNRYIFTIIDEVIQVTNERELKLTCNYSKLYIQSMTKNQIRILTQRMTGITESEKCTPIVEKMMKCFKNTNLPKTPFITSLILSVCQENKSFEPVNEAIIMENFMEMLLEKLSPEEVRRSDYSYKLKINFLIHLVTEMYQKNEYFFSVDEFSAITRKYHETRSFDLKRSKFSIIFFEKNILVEYRDKITFRYSCMIEYLLAIKAINNIDFLEEILENYKYIDFFHELVYYTGLVDDGKIILGYIENKFIELLENNKSLLKELDGYKIMSSISMPEHELKDQIIKKRYTIEESDALTDRNDNSRDDKPIEMDKNNKNLEYKDDKIFFVTLQIYGEILKNCETLLTEEKERILKNYLTGLCIVLAKLKINLEEQFNVIKKNINEEIEEVEHSDKEEDFYRFAEDFFKLTFPLILENMALENIGSPKLREVFINYYNSCTEWNSFEKFLITFLCADLRVPEGLDYLEELTKKTDNKCILTISFYKLLYYYKFGYFREDFDIKLENLLADINIRIHKGKYASRAEREKIHNPKSDFIKQIKKIEREKEQED